MNVQAFYTDHLFKKAKPKSDVLESRLELTEQQLSKSNECVHSLYNVSIPTQDDVWVCGRIFSENSGGGGGKLTDHNVALQGSYVCSNSHSIPLSLGNCSEYSLFPGQIVLARGRNPDGKRFLCKEIIEPPFVAESGAKRFVKKEEPSSFDAYETTPRARDPFSSGVNTISVGLEPTEDLIVIAAAGPYMTSGSLAYDTLHLLIDVAKAKNAHLLILMGPFVDANHDIVASGNMQATYEELLQTLLDEIAGMLKDTRMQVLIQPSLHDVTQEPIYPVHPLNVSPQFVRNNEAFHFMAEPSMVKVNDTLFAITTTDIIKDLTMTAVFRTSSSDKISRNFVHLLRQRSFYPIYPPPDHVCVDFEAWRKYATIDAHPKVFIAVSDLATFVKDVNNCTCLNTGKLVKGTSTGAYAQIAIASAIKQQQQQQQQQAAQTQSGGEVPETVTLVTAPSPKITVTFHKI